MHLIRKVSSADAPGCSTHWHCFQHDWIKMVQFASQASPNIKLPKLVSLEFSRLVLAVLCWGKLGMQTKPSMLIYIKSCHINAWLYLYKILLSNKNLLVWQIYLVLIYYCLPPAKVKSAISSVRNCVVLAKRCCNEGGDWRLLSGAEPRVAAP